METRRVVDVPARGRADGPAVVAARPARKLRWWTALLWVVVAGLLFLAFRQVPLAQVGAVLSRLGPAQVVALVALNSGILLLMAARWSLVLRAMGVRVPLRKLLIYRLAGFGVTYLTPGPQFGGEPVQVHLLHSRQGIPLATAASSVFLERVIDLLANFTFLVLGVMTVVLSGLVGGLLGAGMWALVLGLLAFPVLHLLALSRGYRPAAGLFCRLAIRFASPALLRLAEMVDQIEKQVAVFLCEQPLALARSIALAGLNWLALIFEFWLSLRFLGIVSGPVETISALTAARLAFLMPLPGGLGALEASQSLATDLLGWGPAVGIAVSLLIRARDTSLAVLGLWLGARAYHSALLESPESKERS